MTRLANKLFQDISKGTSSMLFAGCHCHDLLKYHGRWHARLNGPLHLLPVRYVIVTPLQTAHALGLAHEVIQNGLLRPQLVHAPVRLLRTEGESPRRHCTHGLLLCFVALLELLI
jgi:hypothetical protein